MKTKVLLLLLCLYCCDLIAQVQSTTLSGTVISSKDNTPLPGVNIIIKGTTNGTSTDAEGNFTLLVNTKDVLIFSFIGFRQVQKIIDNQTHLDITLEEDVSTLGEVTIVSTGYQQLPKERSNGSFVQVDRELVNRRVSTDVMSRLEDITNGLIFNRNTGKKNDISIRGTSTINSSSQPLIVIDNFPYDGDVNTLNPNDVESITVLKDAAAASIWGAKAGNGVIVITTKKGKQNMPMQASFNLNITVADKPDLFYQPRMSSAEFIGVEQKLFDNGYYVDSEYSYYNGPITPAVELMIANRDGLLTNDNLQSGLAQLATQDIRNDYSKYLYRKTINRQAALSISGGGANNRYYFSAGWDKNTDNLIGNGFNRITLNLNNSWTALKDKLTINAGIYYSENDTKTNAEDPAMIFYDAAYPIYPYAMLKDKDGNNVPLIKDYRQLFTEQAQQNGFLNWEYNPINERTQHDNHLKLRDYRINTSLNYQIIDGLNAEVLYQYWRGLSERNDLHTENSYYARNLVNLYSTLDDSGNVINNIPQGAIYDTYNGSIENHSVRGQLNFNRTFGNHSLTALGGYEVREQNNDGLSNRYYGYNSELGTSNRVDYVTPFEQYNFPGYFTSVPYADQVTSLTDRYISVYGNASYTYKNRYSWSGSARKDQSNLFGVRGNQRGVPLWSTGIGWVISSESFYKFSSLPYLKLRTTYGYNGNINKNTSAYTTAVNVGSDFITGLPYSIVTNPPNPDLRWERVGIWNAGVDYEWKNRRVHGSIEFYTKKGMDLIGTSPYAPSTGVVRFTSNTAATKGHGLDVVINSLNIDRAIKWNTTFLFSTIREKVSSYQTKTAGQTLITYGNGFSGVMAPTEGKPLYAIYSYPWAGLDPETGNPQSTVDGVVSTDYNAILSKATPETITYHGSARPTSFGSLRNTLAWKNISLSFNISYRLGYYFRKNSVRYAELLSGHVEYGDYAQRWQNPGDEVVTHVPSMPDQIDYSRDEVYNNSSVLVSKADNIRLQDINLTYTLDKELLKRLPVNRIQVYSYVNNIGIIWKSASGNIDPDFPALQPVRSIAIGIRADF